VKAPRLTLVGDRSATVTAHTAIEKSLALAKVEKDIGFEWIPTRACETYDFAGVTGIWCVPGSPYASMDGALKAIRFARENRIPFLGTCGGFQHALIEYARNVVGLRHAEHEESSPGTETVLISRLSCSLAETSGEIRIQPGSRLQQIYGAEKVKEPYNCNFGLNSRYEELLQDGKLLFSGRDVNGEVRAFELRAHPFFLGTLFQPERRALNGQVHPIVAAFIHAAAN